MPPSTPTAAWSSACAPSRRDRRGAPRIVGDDARAPCDHSRVSTPEHPDDVPFDMRELRHVALKELPDLPELIAAAKLVAEGREMIVEAWAWDELRKLAVTLEPGADITPERLAEMALFCTNNGLGRPPPRSATAPTKR